MHSILSIQYIEIHLRKSRHAVEKERCLVHRSRHVVGKERCLAHRSRHVVEKERYLANQVCSRSKPQQPFVRTRAVPESNKHVHNCVVLKGSRAIPELISTRILS